MTHDPTLGDSAELAALYAAGAMPPAERVRFEDHLDAGCASCQDELDSLGATLAELISAAPPVSPDPLTRETLLRRVAAEKSSPLLANLGPVDPSGASALLTRRTSDSNWEPTQVPGVSIRVLAVDRAKDQFTALVRMEAGSAYPRHVHGQAEHCLVLEGELRVGDDVLRAGDYQLAPAGTQHPVQSTPSGCLLFVVSSLSDEFT